MESKPNLAPEELGEDILRLLLEEEIHEGYGDTVLEVPAGAHLPVLPTVGPTNIEGQ